MRLSAQLANMPSQGPSNDLWGAGIPFLQSNLVHVDIGIPQQEHPDLVAYTAGRGRLTLDTRQEAFDPLRCVAATDSNPRLSRRWRVASQQVAGALKSKGLVTF
jgi:hypothetical protein